MDLGGPRKEFFLLILREIKEKLFDDGVKENQEKDCHTVAVIFGKFCSLMISICYVAMRVNNF